MLKSSPPPNPRHQPPRGPDALSQARETRTPVPPGKLLRVFLPRNKKGSLTDMLGLCSGIRSQSPRCSVFTGSVMWTERPRRTDRQMDRRQAASRGLGVYSGPAPRRWGQGCLSTGVNSVWSFGFKTHPTLFLANRESLFPHCACVSGEKH